MKYAQLQINQNEKSSTVETQIELIWCQRWQPFMWCKMQTILTVPLRTESQHPSHTAAYHFSSITSMSKFRASICRDDDDTIKSYITYAVLTGASSYALILKFYSWGDAIRPHAHMWCTNAHMNVNFILTLILKVIKASSLGGEVTWEDRWVIFYFFLKRKQ